VFITYSYTECPKCGEIVITEKHGKAGIKGDSPRIGDSLICQNSACGEKFKIKELKLKSGPLKGSYRLIAGPDGAQAEQNRSGLL
jgi:hypothetical protein